MKSINVSWTRNVLVQASAAIVAGSLLSFSASAAGLSYNFDTTYTDGSIAPDGAGPFAVLGLDDGGTAGSVQLSLEVSGDVGIADLTRLYLNLDPSLDASDLTFTRLSGTGPTAGQTTIEAENDSFKAGGSGSYDIRFWFTNNTFNAGESLVYLIEGINSLTVNSFDYLSVNEGGNGPFPAAVKFQSTAGGMGSAWLTGDGDSLGAVPPVPVPAAVWMLGSGLGFLAWKGRRSIAAAKK